MPAKRVAKNLTNSLVNRLQPRDKPYEVRDADSKGLIVRVQPSGYMTYYFEYARGNRIRIGSADGEAGLSPAAAREAAKQIVAQYAKSKVGLAIDPIEERKKAKAENYLSFLELYKPHLEATLRKGADNTRNVTETLANLKNGFPTFHRLRLDQITPKEIDRWKQSRAKEGVSQARIKRQLNDLSACLSRAVMWGMLSSSPFDKLESVKVDANAKVRYLTDKEEQRLRTALNAREAQMKAARKRANEWRAERGYPFYAALADTEFADHLRPAVLLSLNTGIRQGELFNLKWTDVDFEQRNLTIAGEGAKSGQTRHIPLNEESLSVLMIWKQQPGIKSALVFHNRDGKPFDNIRKSWVAVLEAAEISEFRWHDLRHTFASNLVMKGVELNTVRELLGHSDYKMTLRYAHLAPKVKRDAVNRLTPSYDDREVISTA